MLPTVAVSVCPTCGKPVMPGAPVASGDSVPDEATVTVIPPDLGLPLFSIAPNLIVSPAVASSDIFRLTVTLWGDESPSNA